jgi:hypothetical protein
VLQSAVVFHVEGQSRSGGTEDTDSTKGGGGGGMLVGRVSLMNISGSGPFVLFFSD